MKLLAHAQNEYEKNQECPEMAALMPPPDCQWVPLQSGVIGVRIISWTIIDFL